MTAGKELGGPLGLAVPVPMTPDVTNAATTVCAWIITAPSFHPLWSQYLLSVIRLVGVPITSGLPAPVLHFPGATHEVMVAALDPSDGPHRVKTVPTRGLPVLYPINIAEQFTATDDEMTELAMLCTNAVLMGALNPETSDAPERIRSDWLAAMVRTLADARGEDHDSGLPVRPAGHQARAFLAEHGDNTVLIIAMCEAAL